MFQGTARTVGVIAAFLNLGAVAEYGLVLLKDFGGGTSIRICGLNSGILRGKTHISDL
jgi:hypothetical protein